jgi:hypothetical protein
MGNCFFTVDVGTQASEEFELPTLPETTDVAEESISYTSYLAGRVWEKCERSFQLNLAQLCKCKICRGYDYVFTYVTPQLALRNVNGEIQSSEDNGVAWFYESKIPESWWQLGRRYYLFVNTFEKSTTYYGLVVDRATGLNGMLCISKDMFKTFPQVAHFHALNWLGFTSRGTMIAFQRNGDSERVSFRSTDGGLTWSVLAPGIGFREIHPCGDNLVCVTSSNLVYLSKDDGLTWTRIRRIFEHEGFPLQMVRDHLNDRVIIVRDEIYEIDYSGEVRRLFLTKASDLWESKDEPYLYGYSMLNSRVLVRDQQIYADPEKTRMIAKQVIYSEPDYDRLKSDKLLVCKLTSSRDIPEDVIECHILPFLFPRL